jgi:hypothetical protein
MSWGSQGIVHTASQPFLSCHPIHSGNLFAKSTPISSLPASAASIRGVSQSLFLLTISSSWPASIRNSAMATKPCFAARWRDVLDLSSKSGLRRYSGLLRTTRFTRERSFRRMARRKRRGVSILVVYQLNAHSVHIQEYLVQMRFQTVGHTYIVIYGLYSSAIL